MFPSGYFFLFIFFGLHLLWYRSPSNICWSLGVVYYTDDWTLQWYPRLLIMGVAEVYLAGLFLGESWMSIYLGVSFELVCFSEDSLLSLLSCGGWVYTLAASILGVGRRRVWTWSYSISFLKNFYLTPQYSPSTMLMPYIERLSDLYTLETRPGVDLTGWRRVSCPVVWSRM